DQGERRVQPRRRRTDKTRQAVVLPLREICLRRQPRRGNVLQSEREQGERTALGALNTTGDPASGSADRADAIHVSSESEEQDWVHVRPGGLLWLSERRDGEDV